MEKIIKDCFKKVAVPTDDRHKHLIKLLSDKFDEEVKKKCEEYLIETLEEGFELLNINTQKIISITDGEQWEVRLGNNIKLLIGL